MNISDLPMGNAPVPVRFEHFPVKWQAFLWRNWEYVPPAKLAEILQCPEQTVLDAAAELGLPMTHEVNPKWLLFGYLAIIVPATLLQVHMEQRNAEKFLKFKEDKVWRFSVVQ